VGSGWYGADLHAQQIPISIQLIMPRLAYVTPTARDRSNHTRIGLKGPFKSGRALRRAQQRKLKKELKRSAKAKR
jgi:hypothetical protein